VLNGDGSGLSGGVTVQAGLLEIGDEQHPNAVLAGPVTVDAGGVFGGHGTVAGDLTNSGGTVQPGGSIGVLTITGAYSQTSASTLTIEVSPTAASLLKVTGAASLAGSMALVYDPGTYTARS